MAVKVEEVAGWHNNCERDSYLCEKNCIASLLKNVPIVTEVILLFYCKRIQGKPLEKN